MKIPLLAATLLTVLVSLGVAFAAYLLIRWAGNVDATKQLDPQYAIQFALWIAGGIGGVVALVVAYRRQKVTEEAIFVERFGAAAAQLGSADPAVRLAGVYAMAGVADEGTPAQRQQCVDVLCGYLRLPFDSEADASGLTQRILKTAVDSQTGSTESTLTHRLHDREIRGTILRVLAVHLRPDAASSWSWCDIDLRGALLENANFDDCIFRGAFLADRATFTGEQASFSSGTFSGRIASFAGATFKVGRAHFGNSHFNTRMVSFSNAIFSAETTTWFVGTSFDGARNWFEFVVFYGETTYFDFASFRNGLTSFNGAAFSGETTSFHGVEFIGAEVSFAGAAFNGDKSSFARAAFGEQASFKGAAFGSGQTDFSDPRVWDPGPEFDWDDDITRKPASVLPQAWPPVAYLDEDETGALE